MLAVRVPPSACSTSQSTTTWRSPSNVMSHAARSDRPIRRWISTVRPLCLPRAASRSTRSGDDPGSIEYSAVTQPLPLPRIQRGTSSSTLAVHSTRVRPNDDEARPGRHLGVVALERDRVGARRRRGRLGVSWGSCLISRQLASRRVARVRCGRARGRAGGRRAGGTSRCRRSTGSDACRSRTSSRNSPSDASVSRAANAVSSAELTSVTSGPITSLIGRARNG